MKTNVACEHKALSTRLTCTLPFRLREEESLQDSEATRNIALHLCKNAPCKELHSVCTSVCISEPEAKRSRFGYTIIIFIKN